MQDNIRISIKNDLGALLKKKEFGEFYIGLYNFLKKASNNIYYEEYLKKIKASKKTWNVTVVTNHKKTDISFGTTLDKAEYKRLVKLHKQGDMSKLWTAWDMLYSFKKVADKPIQPWDLKNPQPAWDFNQKKWDYLEVVGKGEKINYDNNIYEVDFNKYKLAIKMIGEDFLNYLEEKENVIEFIGVRYDKRISKIIFGKKTKQISNDNQSIKFFNVLATSNKSVGYKKICRLCLPPKSYEKCLDIGYKTNADFSMEARDIKRNFVDMLVSLGCKKGNIDKNLISNKNIGYVFVR